MDSKNYAIGVLSTVSAILIVGLLVIHSRPDAALGSGMTVRGGTYQLTVGADVSGDQELVYVLNASVDRLIVYRFDSATNQIQLDQGIDLAELRSANQGTTPKKPRGRGRGRRP